MLEAVTHYTVQGPLSAGAELDLCSVWGIMIAHPLGEMDFAPRLGGNHKSHLAKILGLYQSSCAQTISLKCMVNTACDRQVTALGRMAQYDAEIFVVTA